MRRLLTTLTLGVTLAAGPALAELMVPILSYRTGPYAANGIPVADGMQDYITLVNERDGGVGGVRIASPECETGYNTEKGVECYEATKGDGALVYMPWSTGITYQLIPRATEDGIPLQTMGYGRTSAANGEVFRYVFNYPANYWDGASVAIKHLLEESGGDLEGKTIGLVYHNSAFGKEPIRTLQELSAEHGFELIEFPVEHPGQEQRSTWVQVRQQRPDYVIMYGWGVMNSVAIQEATNIRYPMENFIGIWFSGSENDVRGAGAGADGYKALSLVTPGTDFPVYDDLEEYVYSKGLGAGSSDQHGTMLYNFGLYQTMMIVEAIRKAQEIHGTAEITSEQMRDGMEQVVIDAAKLEELGMSGFGPTFEASCENHGGSGQVSINQWNAETGAWESISDYIQSDRELITRLVDEDSAAYAQEAGITPGCPATAG